MIKLLQLEWKKFNKNSVVQMLLWIFIIFFPAIIFIGKQEGIDNPPLFSADAIFKFPTVWDWLGYDGNWMVFFTLGFLIVYMISIEISYKTMRQNIITGLSRRDFFMSKLNLVILFALGATILYAIVAFIVGWFHTPAVDFAYAMDNDYAILRFFLMSLTYLLFAMFIGFAIKNSGLAVLTYLAYGIIIEPVIRHLGHSQIVKIFQTEEFPERFASSAAYYPLNAAEDLMPVPLGAFFRNNDSFLFLSYTQAAVTSIIYCAIFIGLTYYIFIKRDM